MKHLQKFEGKYKELKVPIFTIKKYAKIIYNFLIVEYPNIEIILTEEYKKTTLNNKNKIYGSSKISTTFKKPSEIQISCSFLKGIFISSNDHILVDFFSHIFSEKTKEQGSWGMIFVKINYKKIKDNNLDNLHEKFEEFKETKKYNL